MEVKKMESCFLKVSALLEFYTLLEEFTVS